MSPSGRQQTRKSNDSSVQQTSFPFTAIVGQEEMKLALILNVVDPSIGGVLLMGHRGTGKSTAVRALADLLPHILAVFDCPFNCHPKDVANLCYQCRQRVASELSTKSKSTPVVDLPLGSTEDRVCGSINIERALREGVKSFEPGLLAHANRGFLYIDEVNLLEDHLVDLLLDVAATGRNKVERESVSVEHPSQFVLVGSGNPEEGELRPQLLDRFGLHVDVVTPTDVDQRMTIVERREAFDRDAERFCASYADEQQKLRARIVRAHRNFSSVKIDRGLLKQIVELCIAVKVDGHRGELTLMRTSRALAALEGRRKVTEADVRRVAALCLRHRLRRNAFEEAVSDQVISQAVGDHFSSQSSAKSNSEVETNSSVREFPSPPAGGVSKLRIESDQALRSKETGGRNWKRNKSLNSERGRHTRSVSNRKLATIIALAATLRAMVSLNLRDSSLTPVGSDSLRYKLFSRKHGALFIFAIDTSGSMAARRIALAKEIMLDRLRQSYVNRDRVAIISFRGSSAKLELPPSRSILRARRTLDSLTMGGGTPLAAGLARTIELLKSLKNSEEPMVLLFTDGHANVPMQKNGTTAELRSVATLLKTFRARILLVDTQHQFESSAETQQLAGWLNAEFIKLTSF